MIESGTLNDRIRFLSPVTIRNKYGEQLTSWEPSYTCWAKVTYNKGVRAITAGVKFVCPIRYRSWCDIRIRSMTGSVSRGMIALIVLRASTLLRRMDRLRL